MALRLSWVVGFCLLSNLLLATAGGAESEIKFKKVNLELSYKKNKKTIKVELAETQQQHARGLMFRKKLNLNEGMLFIFPDEQTREFWMKNTLIQLDIGYFNKSKTLIDIQQMQPENSIMKLNTPTYPSKLPAQYALEMSAGWFKKNKFPEGTTFKIMAGP